MKGFPNITISEAVKELNKITKVDREQFRKNECCEKMPVFVSKSNKEYGLGYAPQIMLKVPSQKCGYIVWECDEMFFTVKEYRDLPLFWKGNIETIVRQVNEQVLKVK